MAEMTLRTLDRELLPAFLPYLLPEAAQAVAEGDGEVIALGAVTRDHRTCGAAAALREEGFLTLFSLYVDPGLRRRGVATLLLDGLLEAVPGGSEARAEWVLPQPDFDGMAAFFRTRGFSCGPAEEPVYRLESAHLRRSPLLRRAFSPTFRPDGNIVPYAALSPALRAELLEDRSIPGWLRPDGFDPGDLLPEMSLCYVYGGRVAAYLLIGESGPGACAVLAALSRKGAHPAAFLQLASAVLRAGLDHFGGDFLCWLDPQGAGAEDLARRLTGDGLIPWWTGRAERRG